VRRGQGPRAPAERAAQRPHGDLLLGFLITALNPTLIATWTAAVSAAYATGHFKAVPQQAPLFAASVCAGIVGWFAVLLGLTRRYGARVSRRTLGRLVRVLGALLIGMGLWFGARFVLFLAGR
jgi:threonine/homoserine/homoserine lactone efflux protein